MYLKQDQGRIYRKNELFCCEIKILCINLLHNQRYEVVLMSLNQYFGSSPILLKNRRSCK